MIRAVSFRATCASSLQPRPGLRAFFGPVFLLVSSGFLFEGGIKPCVSNGNGQAILSGEAFDELNLFLTECRLRWPDMRQLGVIYHAISTHVDSTIDPLAELPF
jgi:hypothetical protein